MEREIAIKERLWRGDIEKLRERSKSYVEKENLIAFYGSSSIRMWDHIEEDLAPHSTINLGFGGSSYYWCDFFFKEVFEFIRPSKLILYAGDNDLGSNIPQDEVLDSVKNLITKIDEQLGLIPLAIISVKPSPERTYLREKIKNLNEALSNLIHKRSNGSFIEIHSQMLDDQGQVRQELYLDDQLHMNLEGYKIWGQVISKHLNRW